VSAEPPRTPNSDVGIQKTDSSSSVAVPSSVQRERSYESAESDSMRVPAGDEIETASTSSFESSTGGTNLLKTGEWL
jgi:hypothetical protein